jgi:hypothetical protein
VMIARGHAGAIDADECFVATSHFRDGGFGRLYSVVSFAQVHRKALHYICLGVVPLFHTAPTVEVFHLSEGSLRPHSARPGRRSGPFKARTRTTGISGDRSDNPGASHESSQSGSGGDVDDWRRRGNC